MALRKVKAVRDDSAHWYIIPSEKAEEFNKLLDETDDEYTEFEEKFSKYRTGGDVNNVQLYAEIE